MKLVLLSLIMMNLIACQDISQNDCAQDKPVQEKTSASVYDIGVKVDTGTSLSIKSADVSFSEPSDQVQNELKRLIESTKRIILESQVIPGFKQDTTKEGIRGAYEAYLKLDCSSRVKFAKRQEFTLNDIADFEFSSSRTGLNDGKLFCLRTLEFPNSKIARLIYRRSEGCGHFSGELFFMSIDNNLKLAYELPLSYHYGRDGLDTVVESKLLGNKFIRTITERYGWSSTHPDSLDKQPRRVVTQTILLNDDGKMEILNENIVKYNIDELFN